MNDLSSPQPPIENGTDAASVVTLRTLFRFHCGRSDAILKLAATRPALWVGLLFVMSAGIAREYDGEDLLDRPYFLAIPVERLMNSEDAMTANLCLLALVASWRIAVMTRAISTLSTLFFSPKKG